MNILTGIWFEKRSQSPRRLLENARHLRATGVWKISGILLLQSGIDRVKILNIKIFGKSISNPYTIVILIFSVLPRIRIENLRWTSRVKDYFIQWRFLRFITCERDWKMCQWSPTEVFEKTERPLFFKFSDENFLEFYFSKLKINFENLGREIFWEKKLTLWAVWRCRKFLTSELSEN